jgi:hypothetical protein
MIENRFFTLMYGECILWENAPKIYFDCEYYNKKWRQKLIKCPIITMSIGLFNSHLFIEIKPLSKRITQLGARI